MIDPQQTARCRLTVRRFLPAPTTSSLTTMLDMVRRLDLEAAVELQHGHIATAERLAHRAAELRGVA